tara:strand:+ start:790 stop:1185 length:396 start_codon:yes stop_codon:yes gene_type:complete
MTSKYLTTICLLLGTILPLIVDTGHTHLLNPDWDAHSRVHEVWRLSTNIFIAGIGLYLLWISNYSLLPALLSVCIVLGFFSAIFTMSLYGGVPIGEGIDEPNPFGIPANIFVFLIIAIIQSISLIFIFQNR